jgi:hypothetical protein
VYGPIAAQFPLIAGEIGQYGCQHDFIDQVIDWMESKGQSYMAWAWWTQPCASAPFHGLLTDYNGTPSPGYGQGYRDRLAALTQPPGFTTTASALPVSVARGNTVAITANVTSANAIGVLVEVVVRDPTHNQVHQQVFDNQIFTAGQQRSFPVSWPVPNTAATGTYTVQVGVFPPGGGTLYHYNNAGQFTVSATAPSPTSTPTRTATPGPSPTSTVTATPTPNPCSPPREVVVTTTAGAPGRLNVLVTAPAGHILRELRFVSRPQVPNPNAQLEMNGQVVPALSTQVLPPNASQASFVVQRAASGVATTVHFITVVEGPCPSLQERFVGGGPGAF